MRRKFIIRRLLAFSLLAALVLGGCGTNPEPSESKQKNGQPETVLTTEEKAGEKADETSSAAQPADAATVAAGKDGNEANVSKGSTSAASSDPGSSGKASEGNGSSSNTAGSGNSTTTSGKAGSGNSASSGTTSSKGGSGSSSSTASSGSTASPGSTPSSGSTASTGGTGSSGTNGGSQPSKPVQKAEPAASASISIKGPDDAGMILGVTTVDIKDGDTVLDVLLRAAGKKGIDVDYTGSGPTAYVAGIANYYERDYGSRSGWVSKKNGKNLEKGAGIVKVSNGDRIEWVYTEDFLKKE
ncbi:DUF4430 domain-containing protein [Neobacillus sp. SCS-31]|uniref:DUF4430 domain-containing protein n=1 Tax=Neobacillus oceani TaxID=3115292 RepID=UPI0039063835